MPCKCAICGIESEIEEYFVPGRKSSRIKAFYCPTCWEKHTTQIGKSYLIACAIVLVGGLTWVITQFQNEIAWLVFQVGVFMLFAALVMIPHELGHVLAAYATGSKIFLVSFGTSGPFYKCIFGGIEWKVYTMPLGGFVRHGIKSTKLYRIRSFLVTLGGPMTNLLLAFIGLAFFYRTSSIWIAAFTKSFIAANIFTFMRSLVPRKINVAGKIIPCDGLRLLTVPFMSKSDIECDIEKSYVWEGYSYQRDNNLENAKSCYEQGLIKFPNSFILQERLAEIQLDARNYAYARTLFVNLRKNSQHLSCRDDIRLLNGIATADVMIGTNDLLDEADAYSRMAYEKLPWHPDFKWTRGLVLIKKGDIEKGLALLKEANIKPDPKSLHSSYIAQIEKTLPSFRPQML